MINLRLRNSLLYACCAFCLVVFRLNAANVTYMARSNEYFDIAPVQYVKTRSAIECCVRCEFDETCSTANYNVENSECELLTQRPQLRVDFVTRLNWTFYVKPVSFDEDWVYFNQSYYLLVKEKMDWYHADGYCMTLGAELVDIHSAEEQNFVYNYHTLNSVGYVWCGLNDITEEGSFRWSSGRPTCTTYTPYSTGQPNGGRAENCILTFSNTWSDYACSRLEPFICEKSAN